MSMTDPSVKTIITKKSPNIIITEDGNNIVLDSTDGTSDDGGKIVGNDIVFIERFWADDVIKFSGTYDEMPEALDDEDVGTKITLEEYKTGERKMDGTAIWYWPNGNKYKEYGIVNGNLHGSYKIWWENGDINTIGERKSTDKKIEMRIGTWEYYDEEGTETEIVWSE